MSDDGLFFGFFFHFCNQSLKPSSMSLCHKSVHQPTPVAKMLLLLPDFLKVFELLLELLHLTQFLSH